MAPAEVPSLQVLALHAVAGSVHAYEPEYIGALPYGGALDLVTELAKAGRLRPETLRPLLLFDSASVSPLASTLGDALVTAAPGCRGLGALAAQRIHFEARRRQQAAARREANKADEVDECALPSGTRRSDAARSSAAVAAR